MYTNNLEQLIKFGYFIITGIILSIIFDIFRISRRTLKTSDIITNIEDIIFGIITAIIIISSIYIFNNGELRFYIFFGIVLGISIHMFFFSKYFIKINVIIINMCKKIIALIIKPFIFIIKLIRKIFFKPIYIIIINLKGFILKLFKMSKKVTKNNKKDIKQEGF